MSASPSPVSPVPSEGPGFLAPSPTGRPVSHCIRCGAVTPPDVSLCDADNPGRIKAPSATQLHATILGGVVLGIVLLLVLLRLAVDTSGPFAVGIGGHVVLDDGAVQVALNVTNDGDHDGVATCRITRDGTPRPDDLAFRTELMTPGETVTLTRTVPAPDGGGALDPGLMTVICT